MQSIILALIIVLLLLLVIWLLESNLSSKLSSNFRRVSSNLRRNTDYAYDAALADPEELYQRTTGHLSNDTSRLALRKAKKQNNKTESAQNAFIIGELYRFNEGGLIPETNNFYQQAVERIIINPIMNLINADHILDRVAQFYETEFINNINIDLQRAVLNDAQEIVRNQHKTQAQKQKDYYKKRQHITSDPQNVHERQVIDDGKIKYSQIINHNGQVDFDGNIDELNDFVSNYNTSEKKKEKAMRILELIKTSGRYSIFDEDEAHILAHIWERIHSKDNKSNKKQLRAALVDALADCMEEDNYGNSHPVCMSGRVARVLNSLTLMDADKKIAEPTMTREMVRNEALSKAYKVLQDALGSADPELVAKYNAGAASEDITKFTNDIKNKIRGEIMGEYADRVRTDDLENIVKDAQAGI